MRVGLIQSNYIPWRGYFDFIDNVDLFIFHDDLQYTKKDWRNRNIIKTSSGKKWLTVPVNYTHVNQLIKDTPIDYNQDWLTSHIRRFTEFYKKSPYFSDAIYFLESLENIRFNSISNLNRELIKNISEYLNIKTPIEVSWSYSLHGTKTDRIIELLKKTGATEYLSGSNADIYLNKELFIKNNIQLEYKSYSYKSYPQLWGDFIGEVTILDLIANCGKDSRELYKSTIPNSIIIKRRD
jgi:hypothetical protein